MPTITIRGVPTELVRRIKDDARRHGRSMERELRELLAARYRGRADAVADVRARWERMPPTGADEVDAWIREGREGRGGRDGGVREDRSDPS